MFMFIYYSEQKENFLDFKTNHGVVTCAMYNLNVPESSYHFLEICPVLKEFRKYCKKKKGLRKRLLTLEEVMNSLKGSN